MDRRDQRHAEGRRENLGQDRVAPSAVAGGDQPLARSKANRQHLAVQVVKRRRDAFEERAGEVPKGKAFGAKASERAAAAGSTLVPAKRGSQRKPSEPGGAAAARRLSVGYILLTALLRTRRVRCRG